MATTATAASTGCYAAKAKEVDYVTVIMFTPKTGDAVHAAASQFTFLHHDFIIFANFGEFKKKEKNAFSISLYRGSDILALPK